MKQLKAAIATMIMAGTMALPALAESKPAELFYEQAEVGSHDNVKGKAEWSQVNSINTVQLVSGSAFSGTAGYSLVLVKSLAKNFEQMPKCIRLRFRMQFKDQMHAHVRPTIRVGYAYEQRNVTFADRFDLNWNDYKDMLDKDGPKDWYDIDLRKLLEEKANQVKKTECKLSWIAIGGRELYRKGIGNNAFLDVNIAALSLSQETKNASSEAVPIQVHTDVAGDNLEKWSKDLNGTI